MGDSAKKITSVTVFRYNPGYDKEPYYVKYEVPYDPNESVLGVLDYIRTYHDSSFSFRSSCQTGCCMVCTFRLNGKNVVTCRTRMQENMLIEPVNKDKVIKDLVANS